MPNLTAEHKSSEAADAVEALDEELKREFGACPLCGKRTLAKNEERQWCKNCGWRKSEARGA